jgi:predicted Zn-dependent protease with MMP-like domain
MLDIPDEQFEKMLAEALDSLPQDRIRGLQNVAITYENEPSPEQRKKLKLRGDESLYGLYEGIPLTRRAAATSLFSGVPVTLPDKITIFKYPIILSSSTLQDVREQVRRTLWHEIAHYYGLDHDQIRKLEG